MNPRFQFRPQTFACSSQPGGERGGGGASKSRTDSVLCLAVACKGICPRARVCVFLGHALRGAFGVLAGDWQLCRAQLSRAAAARMSLITPAGQQAPRIFP